MTGYVACTSIESTGPAADVKRPSPALNASGAAGTPGGKLLVSPRELSNYAGMTTERTEPAPTADERSMLEGWLDYHRQTLAWKCEGLTDAQLRTAAVEPSTLSLMGLVRHMADVERGWFRRFMAGEDAAPLFSSGDDPDGEFDNAVADDRLVAEAWEAWRTEIEFADRFVAGAPDLDITGKKLDRWRGALSLRWVLLHMIEEYARHNGHADLLRERIDGRLGQ